MCFDLKKKQKYFNQEQMCVAPSRVPDIKILNLIGAYSRNVS